MSEAASVEAIVLAAGKGVRMGRIKPLVEIDGRPALARVLATLRGAGMKRVIVILGHRADEIQENIDLADCVVAVNGDYESGMGSSLALGIGLVSEDSVGFLVVHADMPYVREETVRSILKRARTGAKIVAPTYKGARGFPVYLRVDCRNALLPTLTGEVGARDYIAKHEHDLELIEVDDPGATIDIDRPEDVIGG